MLRGFSFSFPKNKDEAITILSVIDAEWSNISSIKSKRNRCVKISEIFKVVKHMYKVSRKLYLENNSKDMRDVSVVFSKWMKKNGCMLS
tara:strand:- start:324 stop:590 length:267 start_codon:yes stop_codon:yes gene_type:complete